MPQIDLSFLSDFLASVLVFFDPLIQFAMNNWLAALAGAALVAVVAVGVAIGVVIAAAAAAAVASAAAAAVTGAVLIFVRRPKTTGEESDRHLAEEALLSPPLARPGYSDRMAYVLAEMSDLAYCRVLGSSGFIDDAAQQAEQKMADGMTIRQFLDEFSTDLMSGRRLSLEELGSLLGDAGFRLLDVIDIRGNQGFVCKRDVEDEAPYLILAFRGTERNPSEWLTDARCAPTVEEDGSRAHTGFVEAFAKNRDTEGRSVEDRVGEILDLPESKDENGALLPLYLTGHSRGAALALLATKRLAPDVNGACYTFGAPRIGSSDYFQSIKTPVYRMVNSSDIVPRAPLGAVGFAVANAARVAWRLCSSLRLPLLPSLFDWLERFADKLNGYRHHGELRYLSDIAAGQFDSARLSANPSIIDQIVWVGKHLTGTLFIPVKGHGMIIYRKKLVSIAMRRNAAS